MKKLLAVCLTVFLFTPAVYASCPEAGQSYEANGRYLWADRCRVHATVEEVDQSCSTAKIRIRKITAAFGMRVNEICRFENTQGGAGDVVWVPIR